MSKTKLLVISQISFAALLSMLVSADSQTIKDYSASGPAQAAAPAPTIDQRLGVVEKKTSYFNNKAVKKTFTYKKKRANGIVNTTTSQLDLVCDNTCRTQLKLENTQSGFAYIWVNASFNLAENFDIVTIGLGGLGGCGKSIQRKMSGTITIPRFSAT